MFRSLRAAYDRAQYRAAMRNVREGFAAFGFPLDHLSDAEIEAGCMRAGRALTEASCTVDDLTRNVQTFAVSLPTVEEAVRGLRTLASIEP